MRTLLNRVALPIILYLVYALFVTLLVPDGFRNLQSALLWIGLVQLVTRWGLRFARWLYHVLHLDIAAYLLTHLLLSARIFLFVALFGYGFLTDGSWIARAIIVLSIPLSVVRFLGAARHLARYGSTFQYSNFWWRPLWDQVTWQANKMLQEGYTPLAAAETRGRQSGGRGSTHAFQGANDPMPEELAVSIFRDLLLLGDGAEPEIGAQIPQRRRRLFGRIEISGEGESFLSQARLNADRTRSKTPFAPFHHYWPTYANMTWQQQAWYFHWRTELRQGKALPTSSSYVMVHAYELINLVGVSSAQEGFDQLTSLWRGFPQIISLG